MIIMRLLGVAVGLAIVWGGASELFAWLRARGRVRRAQGVIVGSVDASMGQPNTRQRAGTFRFTTEDGRVVTGASSASAPWAPRAGKRVTISYDPAHPDDADLAWVKTVKLLLSPVLIIGGLVLAYYTAFGWNG